jgi:hypothetical protein
MNPDEARELSERLDRFKRAEQRIGKLDKAKRVMKAIIENEDHEVENIVINVRHKHIKYTSPGNASSFGICSLTNDDQAEMVMDFIGYAMGQITARMNAAEADKAEA